MELDFHPQLKEQKQQGALPSGTVELFLRFGEFKHRCGVEHYSVTKNTTNRIQRYLGPESSSILAFCASRYAITIKNRVIAIAKYTQHDTVDGE